MAATAPRAAEPTTVSAPPTLTLQKQIWKQLLEDSWRSIRRVKRLQNEALPEDVDPGVPVFLL